MHKYALCEYNTDTSVEYAYNHVIGYYDNLRDAITAIEECFCSIVLYDIENKCSILWR